MGSLSCQSLRQQRLQVALLFTEDLNDLVGVWLLLVLISYSLRGASIVAMADPATLIAAEQVVSTTLETGAVAAYGISMPTQRSLFGITEEC